MSARSAVPLASAPAVVSLRELNQGSGRIVRGVEENRRPVVVTDHGRPIAQIIPIKPDETPYERLLREGHVRPARRGAHHPIVATGELPEGVTLRQLLDEDREEIDLDALR